MDDRTRAWLYDILNAIQEIDSYFDEGEKNLQYFSNTLPLKGAVERELEIIGTSMERFTTHLPETKISYAAEIMDTSERLSRPEEPVSNQMLWGIVEQYLPRIRDEIHLLIIQRSQ